MKTNPATRFDELILALKEHEFRLTPQRVELVRLIATCEDHPSAAQLYERIRTQFPTISPATVYKTLSILKEMKQIMEIDLRDDSHYDGLKPQPHPHIICMQCNKIVDGTLEIDGSAIRSLEQASGYRIHRSQLTFYGICPQCK